MKKKKPSVLSVILIIIHIILSLWLPFLRSFSALSLAVYAVGGLIGIYGSASSRSGPDAGRGAEWLPVFADCLFVAAAVIVFLPEMDIPINIMMTMGGVLAVKAITLLASVLKFKRPLPLRTYLNRLTGLLLFLLPIIWRHVDHEPLLWAICAVACAGALEELAITLISHYPRPNRTALLQKRHIKHVLYGSFMKRAINARKSSAGFVPSCEGINFIGDLSGTAARAESSRQLEQTLRLTGIPVFSADHPSTKNVFIPKRIPRILRERRVRMPYDVSLLRIDASDLPELCARRGPSFFKNNYIIVYWLWEQEHLNPEHRRCLELADEIWTPSEFVSAAVRECTSKPVRTVPYAVTVQPDSSLDRAHFGLPEDTVLYMINAIDGGEWERRNPVAAARAFAAAFPDGSENAGLIIKITDAGHFEQNEIRSAVGVGSKLYFFTRRMDKTEADSLLACADVLISLHRGESFGMTMAQAMLLGKPVVASAWSANTEYMDRDCACPVDCSLAELEYEYEPYHKGSRWAQPDENKASGYIRQLYNDSEKRAEIGQKAAERIKERFGGERAAGIIRQRFDELKENAGIKESAGK